MPESSSHGADQGCARIVTAHVTHRARPGHTAQLEEAVSAVLQGAARADGYLGSAIMRARLESESHVIALVHFANWAQLDAWWGSATTRDALHETDIHLAESAKVEFAEGASSCFDLPEMKRQIAPPKWKMTIVTWLAIFPTLAVFITASFHLLGDMPMVARLFLNTILIAPLMTWVIMPAMTRLFRGWLFWRSAD